MVTYKTNGTCTTEIVFDINQDNIVSNVKFYGGCAGNTQAVAKLVEGMHAQEIIKKLKNINCHNGTSCPDQLARALEIHMHK